MDKMSTPTRMAFAGVLVGFLTMLLVRDGDVIAAIANPLVLGILAIAVAVFVAETARRSQGREDRRP